MDFSLFRHVYELEIRFGDLDAFGHVNNAKYLTYAESARLRYAKELGLKSDVVNGVGPIVARAAVDYKIPLFLEDDKVQVHSRVSRFGNSSYEMEQVVTRMKNGVPQVAASIVMVIVAFDYPTGKPTPVPQEWRDRVTAYEPGLQAK